MKRPLFTLLLARHGEAESNQHGAFLGRSDQPLTERGIRQANSLADKLAHWDIDAIYSSPLQRAANTAKAIAERQELSLKVDERWIERAYGDWEGLVFDEAKEAFPTDYAAWQQNAMENAPTNGENLFQVQLRAREAFQDIVSTSHEQTVLIVAHGGILNVLPCTLFNITPEALWAFRFPTGGFAELLVYEDAVVMMRLESPTV